MAAAAAVLAEDMAAAAADPAEDMVAVAADPAAERHPGFPVPAAALDRPVLFFPRVWVSIAFCRHHFRRRQESRRLWPQLVIP